jgi:hypothetical protein
MTANIPARDPRNETGEASLDLLFDSGRVHAVQKNSTVLAVYQAKAQFLDDYIALRLVLVIPIFFCDLQRMTIGNSERDSSDQPETVWIEDGDFYAALRPLLLTQHGRHHALTVTRDKGYLSISFYNYDGAPRRFSRRELLNTALPVSAVSLC